MWFRHNGRALEVTRGTAEHEQLVKAGAEPIVGPDAAAGSDEEKPLAKRSPKELKEYAEERGIDLGGATKKADILAAIAEADGELEAGEPGDELEDDAEGSTLED